MEPLYPTYNILMVDDNESIHHDVRALLAARAEPEDLDALAAELLDVRRHGRSDIPAYHLDSVYQGEDAVHAVRQGRSVGRAYALAIVDMRMPPGCNGIQTIQQLWKIDSDIQIAICSAYSDYTWEDIVDQLGVSDKLLFLRKPFDPCVLRQLVLASTMRWQRERELRALIGDHECQLQRYASELRELRTRLSLLSGQGH